MEIALQIHHLDDHEASETISILSRSPLPNNWFIQRPTDDTNSVLVRFRRNALIQTEITDRDFLFENTRELLSVFEKDQIDEIRRFNLKITLKIMTRESALPIPGKLLGECGRLGIDLYVLIINL